MNCNYKALILDVLGEHRVFIVNDVCLKTRECGFNEVCDAQDIISVASRITGYSVNYLYHLASSGAIPYVKRGRSLRFDVNELQQWMQQQYIPASNKLSDERKKE